jgi:diaminopimelate epimerase
MKLAFRKYHGLGNDFIIFDGRHSEPELATFLSVKKVASLCNRHLGIGADGVLVLERGLELPYRMVLFNADGSPAEISGNGLRCFLLFLRDIGEKVAQLVQIETGAGIAEAEIVEGERVRVQMPPPTFGVAGHKAPPSSAELVTQLDAAGVSFDAVVVSIGNPHCVIFGPPRDEIFARTYGPLIEKNRIFPAGANVEFTFVSGGASCRLIAWERGVGLTMACGSGAAAAVCAGVALGKLPTGLPIKVSQPGGKLDVIVQAGYSKVTLEGPAQFVFAGEIDI